MSLILGVVLLCVTLFSAFSGFYITGVFSAIALLSMIGENIYDK